MIKRLDVTIMKRFRKEIIISAHYFPGKPGWAAQKLRKILEAIIDQEAKRRGSAELGKIAAALDSLRLRPDLFAKSGREEDADKFLFHNE